MAVLRLISQKNRQEEVEVLFLPWADAAWERVFAAGPSQMGVERAELVIGCLERDKEVKQFKAEALEEREPFEAAENWPPVVWATKDPLGRKMTHYCHPMRLPVDWFEALPKFAFEERE